MDGRFLVVALSLLVFMVNVISACLPKEYKISNVCCPMCDKGFFMKANCIKELISSVCIICAEMSKNHPNGLTECFRCKDCGANFIVKQNCTESSNTVCECSADHFCVNPDCYICQDYTQCQPGQYVKKPGALVTDTECEKCPEGHYSDRNNAAECSPLKKCEELGQILDKEGNSTADSICKEKRSHIGAGLALAHVSLLLAVIIYVIRNPIYKPEMNTQDV
ncbi:tumor necrosis factor receptor superfamily member 14-like isoform X1 [Phyllobates terribilis]|uniref:tumor necrosis factor receptor superfamily member 14-like isoform X1 n=1 Tax=Phyllobates terribilis TaxID=111132 RepID=UPI003CCB41E1